MNTNFTGNVSVAIGTNPFGAGAALSGTLMVTAVGGVATFTGLSLNKAADGYTLQATSGGFSAISSAIMVSTTAATQLVVTSPPPVTVVAGAQFGLVLSAEDGQNNVDPSFTGDVTLDTPDGQLMAPLINGQATFFPVILNTAGAGVTLTATASGLFPATIPPIQVVAATATKLVFVTQPPSTVPAGNFFQVVLAAEDANGNIDANYSGQAMIDLLNGPAGAMFTPVSVPISGGMATITGLSIDQATLAGQSYNLQATVSSGNSLTAALSPPITVTAQAASQLVVTSEPPGTVAAGDTIGGATGVIVSAEDQFGNVDPNFTGTVTVSLDRNGISTTTPLLGTLSEQAAAGVVTFSDLSIDAAAGGYTIVATPTASMGGAVTTPFTVMAGVPTQLLISTQPVGPVTAGTPFNLVVAAADQFGNVNTSYGSAGQTVTVQLTTPINGATLGGTLTLPVQNGTATFSNLTLNRPGSGDVITVSSSGLTGVVTTNPISVNVGAPEQLVVTSEPASQVTAGSASINFIVTAEDSGGNPTPYTGLVTLSLGNNPGGSTLSGTTQVMAMSGQAIFTGLSLNKAGNDYTLLATGAGLAGVGVTGSIDVAAAAADRLVVSAPPPGVVAAAPSTFSLAVSAVDANGNPDPNYQGFVTLNLNDPSGVTATLGGTITLPVNNGVATFSDLTVNTVANGYTITATSNGFSVTSPSINVTPAPVSQLVVTGQPSPNPVTAGQGFSVTVAAEDANGNVNTSFHGVISLTLANNPGGAAPINLTATAVAGVATFTNVSLNKATPAGGQGYTLQASFGALSVTTNPITVNAGAATELEITVGPPTAATIGSGFEVQVTAVDGLGNTDPNFNGPVTLSLQSNPIGATLNGNATTIVQPAMGGTATFSGVTLNKIGSRRDSAAGDEPVEPGPGQCRSSTSLFTDQTIPPRRRSWWSRPRSPSQIHRRRSVRR